MDVTLPIGVATVSGMPPTGGVPDVLAQLAGADASVARDPFAALLAALGLGGVEPPAVPVDAADDDVSVDVSTEPASVTQPAQVAGLLMQATPPATVVALVEAAAVGEVPSGPSAATPPQPAAIETSGEGTKATLVAPPGRVEAPAVAADVRPVIAAPSSASAATPAAPASVAPAEAASAAPVAQRAATMEAPATTNASVEQGTVENAPNPVVAPAETGTDAQVAGRDAAEPQVNAASPAPTRAADASPRPRDAAPLTAPEQPTDVPSVETAAIAEAEPAAVLRRREGPQTPAAGPSADARQATAEAMTSTPRPAAPAQTAPSDATAAYRHAEAATLPELPRPLGRLPDGGEMRLEVTPEGLGPIEIRVSVRADAVQASLWTQQDHTRAALEAHRPMLADALGRSSLRLEEFTVGVGQHHQAAQDDDRTPRRWATPLAAEPVAAPTPTHTPARTRGLSLRA